MRTIELSDHAYETICGLVQPTDTIDPSTVMAPANVWDEIRAAFPEDNYHGQREES